MANPYIEPWSRDYAMVGNATVRTWNEDAQMDAGLYDFLVSRIGEPIVGFIEGQHYQFIRSNQVLSQECAIPSNSSISNPELLVMR